MSYESKSIKEIVEMIGSNKLYLPAIQRKFVWEHEKIESLFDSIMRNFPIGTFLFWFLKGDKDDYTFYKFLDGYHERDKYENQIAPKPELKDEIIGVLDGQQRLSSMYIPLQFSYSYRMPHARKENAESYPERFFYINLMKEQTQLQEDSLFEFKFLTVKEAATSDKDHLWYLVKNILVWGNDPEIDSYYDELIERGDLSSQLKEQIHEKRNHIKKTLRILHQRLVLEKLINYFTVSESDLDNILDIFIRVNSGGTPLEKSDLLFSTIVANWQEGRKEFELFLRKINELGDGFNFDNDFMMRSCLVLADCPIIFKVKSFKKENVARVQNEWETIKLSVTSTVRLLVEYGFSGETLTSQNAVIPIAYYLKKNGLMNPDTKAELRKYLIHSLLKGTYGAQTDRVISAYRDALRTSVAANSDTFVLKERTFSMDQLFHANLPSNRTLKISDDEIEEILDYSKGPYTFMVLSLLYPNLRFGQVKFHQDHIHPDCLFKNSVLSENHIPSAKWKEWQQLKDKLPNLQILEGKENESKNKTPIKEWLTGLDANGNANVPDVNKFKQNHYFPDESLDFTNFEQFYNARKDLLRNEIKRLLQ
ncbi:MAG: DUF262 domain-containing protein [Candidatus Bathyarchaeia archaeon]|jgi:uncharacterized protein with ParB-like and HNH nuclease domain